ncbi:MAG: hypothetical protein RSD28_06200 [Lachnospiraceae bacterium]
MLNLTFGEQVKIILSRKGMTIKELAEKVEEKTGKKMSRQNLTQRLGRDNFQEQDMRTIAEILECPFQLNILVSSEAVEVAATEEEIKKATKKSRKQGKTIFLESKEHLIKEDEKRSPAERDITIGELVDIHEEQQEPEQTNQTESEVEEVKSEQTAQNQDNSKKKPLASVLKGYMKKAPIVKQEETHAEVIEEPEEESITEVPEEAVEEVAEEKPEPVIPVPERKPEINPYTGAEYATNSVRMHPTRIGYVQVYDRAEKQWTDMTEWAFLGYQERKKTLLGKNYEPPIYLD